MSAAMGRAKTILRERFGYNEFRPGQESIVQAVLAGQDVVGVLPTGGGKSVCYQVPALIFPHLTIVVSPLIALMRDQTERLRLQGIDAAAMHGAMTSGEMNQVLYDAAGGRVKLLYVAPERLTSESFRKMIRPLPISLLAVDEAHCISEWGHDFRPAYKSIASFFADRVRVPILALTATATPDVREDVIAALELKKPVQIVRGFDRANLAMKVVQTSQKVEYITQLARQEPASPILIYAGSRRRVDTIADELRKRGVAAEGYHAGMPAPQRSDVQDRFVNGHTRILVATNAFGMGIDKRDVRHVVHTDLTLTLEAYYQEAGRAGRDGQASECTLLYTSQDRSLMDFYISSTYPESAVVFMVWQYLMDRSGIADRATSTEPILADAASIAAAIHKPAFVVNGALGLLERSGILARTSKTGASRIELRTSHTRFLEYRDSAPAERLPVINALLRVLQSREPGTTMEVHIPELVRRNGITVDEFSGVIRSLQLARIIRFVAPQEGGAIVLTHAGCSPQSLPIDWSAVHHRREHAIRKLDVMTTYAETRQCKRNFILSYFGDSSATGTCGRCSSCTGKQMDVHVSPRQAEIVRSLIRCSWQLDGRYGRTVLVDILTGTRSIRVAERRLDRCVEWARYADRSRGEVISALDHAIEAGLLIRSSDLYPVIGVSQSGVHLGKPLPGKLQYHVHEETPSVETELKDALLAMRARLADEAAVSETSLLSHVELERIVNDAPQSLPDLVPGRHGSGLFIAQYGETVVTTVTSVVRKHHTAGVQQRADEEARRVAALVRPGVSLRSVASAARVTPPAAAHALQRALEGGVTIERHDLVSNDLYVKVYEYLRHHRFAKLRHLREYVGGEVDMADLRVAMAFARTTLFASEQ